MKQMFAALVAAALLSAPAVAKPMHAHHAMKASKPAHYMHKTVSKKHKHAMKHGMMKHKK